MEFVRLIVCRLIDLQKVFLGLNYFSKIRFTWELYYSKFYLLVVSYSEMKGQNQKLTSTTYRQGWQIAQAEIETYNQISNRLKSIRAINRLKNGELFLEVIES
ncbi:MAG: hypothetical protein ACJAXX_001067 [Roseivirga sp.]